MMSSSDIRSAFLNYFKSKGHEIVPSAPIIIKNDPTLLFTNAGMNQFKDIFLGNQKPPHKRVADTQKCLRVSGKHNDLEEVGVDTYHHTMFEMLGNWSFGDYFKKEAIAWSWELLTEVYKLPKDRLYVTVFEGDAAEKLPVDDEAFAEWKKWIEPTRIIAGEKKDNFWEMGDSGPCGPCTEIHVDCRPDPEREATPGNLLVNKDHPQVIEIWNNVFIQYNRKKEGGLELLPSKHVDTGMGLERLVRILQEKNSNYDTDLFSGTIEFCEQITGKKYTRGDGKPDVAFRVIADHVRAIAFTIADGQLPSNTGAGYVIRRILRRAVRYYYSYLDYTQPLLFKTLPLLSKQFAAVFPELHQQVDFVGKVVKEEEEAFLRTLDKGLKRIDEIVATAAGAVAGKDAFELYDTYGFPVDLTRLIATENKLSVDEAGFEAEMRKQKERSRAATSIEAEDWVLLGDNSTSRFIGYDSLEVLTKVLKYRKVKSKGKQLVQLVLDTTPFYAEGGGQTGDTGTLFFEGERVEIDDTKKENDLIIHFTEKLPVNITGVVDARVNKERRLKTAVHHTATHLLHAALRKVLGPHVTQKGSLVNDQYLRFDFSHFAKLSEAEVKQVEDLVNEKIRLNIPVVIQQMPKEEALKMGAMALFGEKYGDVVRVVIIDPAFSVELCGGTHVGSTGELGIFKIQHESAVAAGVRRIEAVAGALAHLYVQEQLQQLADVSEQLRHPESIKKAVETLLAENADLRKSIERLENKWLPFLRQELLQKAESINGIAFISGIIEADSADTLKKLCFDLKNHASDYLAVLCANVQGKAAVCVAMDDKVVECRKLDAANIIRIHIAPLIKGGGGGQKNLATAGGQDPGNFDRVISSVRELLK